MLSKTWYWLPFVVSVSRSRRIYSYWPNRVVLLESCQIVLARRTSQSEFKLDSSPHSSTISWRSTTPPSSSNSSLVLHEYLSKVSALSKECRELRNSSPFRTFAKNRGGEQIADSLPPSFLFCSRSQRGVTRFNIHKSKPDAGLPTAHTCFNQLDIPSGFTSYEDFRKKLLIAITEGATGFAFA